MNNVHHDLDYDDNEYLDDDDEANTDDDNPDGEGGDDDYAAAAGDDDNESEYRNLAGMTPTDRRHKLLVSPWKPQKFPPKRKEEKNNAKKS